MEVFPVPGGPYRSMCGRFDAFTILRSTVVACPCDRTSSSVLGLYFSTHGCSLGAEIADSVFAFELEAAAARALLSKKLAMVGSKAVCWAERGRQLRSATMDREKIS